MITFLRKSMAMRTLSIQFFFTTFGLNIECIGVDVSKILLKFLTRRMSWLDEDDKVNN